MCDERRNMEVNSLHTNRSVCSIHQYYKNQKDDLDKREVSSIGGSMRPTLKNELEYAIWKITGLSIPYNEHIVARLSQEIARKTGEDPGEVSMRLAEQIKEIIWEDIRAHYRQRAPCQKTVEHSPD